MKLINDKLIFIKPWILSLVVSIAIHVTILELFAIHSPSLIIGLKSGHTAQHQGQLSIPTITFVSSTALKTMMDDNSKRDTNAELYKPVVERKKFTRVHSSPQKLNSEQQANKIGSKPRNFSDNSALLKIKAPALTYPVDALARKEQGIVVLKASINTSGDIVTVQLMESSGFINLDQAAMNWFAQLKFIPAYKQGIPVNSFLIQKIKFNLREVMD